MDFSELIGMEIFHSQSLLLLLSTGNAKICPTGGLRPEAPRAPVLLGIGEVGFEKKNTLCTRPFHSGHILHKICIC